MARPQEKPVFPSPITERNQEGVFDYDEEETATGCGCFRGFCFGWGRDEAESHSYLLHDQRGLHKEGWLVEKFKKVKEFSELVAGPKWKNFVRRVGKLCNPKKGNMKEMTQFQYSPESYALNFVGDQEHDQEDGNLLHSFSSRFAPGYFINDQQRRAAAS